MNLVARIVELTRQIEQSRHELALMRVANLLSASDRLERPMWECVTHVTDERGAGVNTDRNVNGVEGHE